MRRPSAVDSALHPTPRGTPHPGSQAHARLLDPSRPASAPNTAPEPSDACRHEAAPIGMDATPAPRSAVCSTGCMVQRCGWSFVRGHRDLPAGGHELSSGGHLRQQSLLSLAEPKQRRSGARPVLRKEQRHRWRRIFRSKRDAVRSWIRAPIVSGSATSGAPIARRDSRRQIWGALQRGRPSVSLHRCERGSSAHLAAFGHLLVTACGQIAMAAHRASAEGSSMR